MYGRAVFEVIEVKEAAWSRSGILRLKKNVKNSNIQLCFMLYCHFPTRNGSKSTITTQKSEKVNKGVDFFVFRNINLVILTHF
jgi:hypothetical protein